MKSFKELGISPERPAMTGDKIDIDRIFNREIEVHSYYIKDSKYEKGRGNGKCLYLQISVANEKRVVFSGSGVLMELIEKIPKQEFPFKTTIIKQDKAHLFT